MADYTAGLCGRAAWQGRDSAALCINKAKRTTCVKGRHAARYSAYPQPQSISSNTAGISTTAATATAAASHVDKIRLPVAETIGRRRIRQWQTFRDLCCVELWRGILQQLFCSVLSHFTRMV